MILTSLVLPWLGRFTRKPAQRRLVFASRFDSGSARSALALLSRSGQVYLAAAMAPGCRGASLMARPIKGAYYTVSVWDDEAALQAFARSATHHGAVRTVQSAGEVDGVLMSWWSEKRGRPRWAEVIRRTAAHETGRYNGPETSDTSDDGARLTA